MRGIDTYEVHELQSRTQPDSSDIQPVDGASIETLDQKGIEGVLERLKETKSRIAVDGADDEEILKRLKIVNRGGEVTLAGMLTLGTYPQEFFPQLFIDVTVHPGNAKSTDPAVRFLDRVQCDGRIPVAIESAVKAVLANLRVRHVESGATMIAEPEIPAMVVREAITNAIMHRDYSPRKQGRQVAVDVFADRVEISNPGGLWEDRTLDNIGDGSSVSRNKNLSSLLSKTPIGSDNGAVAENQGSGIQRMRTGMEQAALPQPTFKADIGSFTVVLSRFGSDGQLVAVPGASEVFTLPSQWTPSEQEVLAVLDTKVPKKIADIEQLTGKSKAALRVLLRELIEGQAVVATAAPQSRNRGYLLRESGVA